MLQLTDISKLNLEAFAQFFYHSVHYLFEKKSRLNFIDE